MASHPSTVGEWDIEIATMSTASLTRYRDSLAALREWDSFKGAFGWTRMFVLQQQIQEELDKRARTYCVSCGALATEFRNAISAKEFTLSRLCQKCQDGVFQKSEERK